MRSWDHHWSLILCIKLENVWSNFIAIFTLTCVVVCNDLILYLDSRGYFKYFDALTGFFCWIMVNGQIIFYLLYNGWIFLNQCRSPKWWLMQESYCLLALYLKMESLNRNRGCWRYICFAVHRPWLNFFLEPCFYLWKQNHHALYSPRGVS